MDALSWIHERVVMSWKYGWLCQRLLGVLKETGGGDLFWEETMKEVGEFQKKFSYSYVEKMMLELLDFLEEQEKEIIQEKHKPLSELPAHVQRLLDDCIEMQEKVRGHPDLAKVYSDVYFGKIIGDIEEYREQLRTAGRLFS